MKKIALVTNKDFPKLYKDDHLLATKLSEHNFDVYSVIWDDHSVNWTFFDAIIIRSVWDYHLQPKAFQNWLNALKGNNIRVFNNTDTILKNMHKSYLLNLQNKGLKIIPTIIIPKGSIKKLNEIVGELNLNKFVLKPAISLTAYNTFQLNVYDIPEFETKFREIILENDIIIQPFIESIKIDGEISLIFFEKEFSHAIKKLPAKNDFRVQTDFGGSVQIYNPSKEIINQASKYLKENTLFARVDGIIMNNEFHLMELELIDPVLHFRTNNNAVNKFISSLNDMLSIQSNLNN